MPELRSDQVRTRRCNCNGHNTARALGSTLQLGVADSPSLPVVHRTAGTNHARPTHARQRPHGRDGPSFSLPVSLREDANEKKGRPNTKDTHSVVKAPNLSRKGQARNIQGLSLSCLAKKSRWFLSSSSPSLTCPPRSSSLCFVLFIPSV